MPSSPHSRAVAGVVGPSAFLTVQEGCDKFCTYCVVPYTRGAEISRPYGDLLAEAETLVEAGAREITLLGQNVNAWRGEDAKGRSVGLDALIRSLAKLPRLARIRYTHQPPCRHGRWPDRRARRSGQADALPAPAGPERFGPDTQGDEPLAHGAHLSRFARQVPRRAARYRAERRFHRRFPGRDRDRFRGHARAGRRG